MWTLIRVTAPVLFGRMFVTPILGDYLDAYPMMTAQTLFVDRVVNLMDEGLDVAIRIGNLPDSSLIAVRVGAVRRVLFASPDYVNRHGQPKHPNDLLNHRLIHPLTMASAPDWTFAEKGKPLTIRIAPKLRMNTNDAAIELALHDWGIAHLLSYQIAPDVAAGRLQIVLSDFELPPLPIHVVHREGRMVSAKVRSFVDFMTTRLRADPTLN